MSNLTINANSIYDRVIRIGRQTENLVSSITFNLQMWIDEYGAGECVLNVRRNGDGNAYPVPMTITDGKATWTITNTDTAKKGRGEIQLKYTVGDKVKTSPIFTISCGESLIGEGEPPSGYEDWLTELGEMTAQVEAAKTSASASAQTAQTAAGTAAEKASEAEQSATTASGFANNASASAQSASESAQAAAQSAQAASVARTAAEAAAISAQAEAEDAESAKQAAQTAESNAQGFAQTATEKASQAAESAADAKSEADRAKSEADKAKIYADKAAEVELEIPTKVSQLENDAGYLTEHQSLADYVQKDVLYNMLPVDTASGSIASFPDGADDIPLKSLVVGIEPVQDLHGYDSPWPAGGSVQLLNIPDMPETTRNGVTYHIENGVIYANGTCTGGFAPFANKSVDFASGTYTFSVNLLSGSTSSVNNSFNGYDSSNARWWLVAFGIGTYPGKMTKTADIKTIDIVFNNGTVFNNAVLAFQIEAGSEVSTFRPYSNICPISGWTGMTVNANGTEIPISWESEAGTVYGGTLDVTNGVLTVTKGFIQSYSGEALPSVWISDRDTYTEGGSPTTGAEVCYDLATPITYQLTPHEVKSLLGQNNIWVDTGDTSVEYRADIQRYIEKKLSTRSTVSLTRSMPVQTEETDTELLE